VNGKIGIVFVFGFMNDFSASETAAAFYYLNYNLKIGILYGDNHFISQSKSLPS